MTQELRERAKALANRNYTIDVSRDQTTDGEPVWVLSHPELPYCMAQGDTIVEARKNLADARFEYILSLLEDGLEVPEPRYSATTTVAQSEVLKFDFEVGSDLPRAQEKVLFRVVAET